jgi:hypothetical protein
VVAVLAAPLIAYVSRFSASPLSSNPSDWSDFGNFVGGILNPIVSMLTLGTMIYIARVANRLETQAQLTDSRREMENARPEAEISASDFENMIKVVVKNVGLGPLAVDEFKAMTVNEPESTVEELVKLMPDLPPSLYWRYFNINGLPRFIHPRDQVVLLHLEGRIDDPVFCEFRDSVRNTLKDIYVEIRYSDAYGNPRGTKSRVLSVFGRHDHFTSTKKIG